MLISELLSKLALIHFQKLALANIVAYYDRLYKNSSLIDIRLLNICKIRDVAHQILDFGLNIHNLRFKKVGCLITVLEQARLSESMEINQTM